MKVKIPIARLIALVGKLIKAAKGGISKEEAEELGHDLLEIALSILGDTLPKEVTIPTK